MCKGKQKAVSKVTAVLLALMMVVVFIPTFAFATDGDAAEGITVFMTVSDQGQIAQTKDNEPMAWKEVKVTDKDGDGKYSFDEALVAAHDAYYEGGAAAGYLTGVKRLWGHESQSFLFFVNGEGIPTGVTGVFLEGGEYLTAAYLTDTDLGLDWGTSFDKETADAIVGESVSLKLKGHLGMAYAEEDKTDVPLKDVQLGVWTEDGFSALEGDTTDADGNALLSFDAPGTYVVTLAPGTKVTNTIISRESDGYWYPFSSTAVYDNDDEEIWGKWDWSAMVAYGGYTQNDYGEGPYPYNEIQWVKAFDYNDLNFEMSEEDLELGYFMHSGNVIYDSPAIAPVCIVNVGAKPADVTMTLNNKGVLAKAKDGSAMIKKPVTVKDLDFDGKLTYDEALIAAHDAYYEGGADAGYASVPDWVIKLWGVDDPGCYEATNGTPISNGVSTDTVSDGDVLDVAVLTDDTYYSDRVAEFDKTSVTIEALKTFSIQLSGKGMYDGNMEPFENVKIGTWENGAFKQISNLTTDSGGKATVSFDKAGTYILTASGTVNRNVSVWDSSASDFVVKNLDCPLMAPYCIVKVTPHVHKLTAVKAKLATAKKAGNTAYWSCADCGKFFSDAKATKEIKKDSWIVKKSAMTVKAKTVKGNSKKKTIVKKSKAFTVKKAPGKVTFKKIKGNKKITVSKTGKVTVKKGLKKGKTYTVKVRVTSAKTAKYAKITKTVKLKVKITK